MRTLILAIAATAALALLPATALADPVEILDAATDEPCTYVYWDEYEPGGISGYSEGGCELGVMGLGQVKLYLGSSMNSSCDVSADMNIGQDGRGVLHNLVISGASICGSSVRECRVNETTGTGGDLVWPFEMSHDGAGNRTVLLKVCYRHTNQPYVYRGHVNLDISAWTGGHS